MMGDKPKLPDYRWMHFYPRPGVKTERWRVGATPRMPCPMCGRGDEHDHDLEVVGGPVQRVRDGGEAG